MINIDAIVKTLKSVLPEVTSDVQLHEPIFRGREQDYVKDCIESGWVSSVGSYVTRFEEDLAQFTGHRAAVAVVNGTAALHACLLLADVKDGDEVLIPDLTFVATANVVTYCGAIPHFVDSCEETLGVDPRDLASHLEQTLVLRPEGAFNRKTQRPVKALVAMHTFGHPVDLDPLVEICRQYNLILIEDAAESLGSYYKGQHTGHHGILTAMSFNGNKIVTTGGGGAILTNDKDLALKAKHMTTTSKKPHAWLFDHDQIGFNYRMPNINAALGCAQLEQLSGFLERKRVLAHQYKEVFNSIEGLRFFEEPPHGKSNYWLNALLLDRENVSTRDNLLQKCHDEKIKCRPAWTLMHKLPMYKDCPRAQTPNSEDLEQRLINIPSGAGLATLSVSTGGA